MNIDPRVEAHYLDMVNLRRWFHQHPEVSLKEYKTCQKIEETLDGWGIPHQRIGETGVYVSIKGQPSSNILALRADMDALAMQDLLDKDYHSLYDGCAHACGHDSHTAVLLTAAKILNDRKDELHGEVRLFFQQGEEVGQGARQFVKAGCMDGVQRVFGVHVCPQLPLGDISLTPGPMNASCDYFKIDVIGKSAHVSAPDQSIDALFITSQIVNNLQSIVSRNTKPLDSVVVGIGVMQSGTQYNVISDHGILEGTTRAFTHESRTKTNHLVEKIAKETAAMYGGEANVEFKAYANPLINDEEAVKEVSLIAEHIIAKKHIIHNQEKMPVADDFADYLQICKGVYAFAGTRNEDDPDTAMNLHHGKFDIDETYMKITCSLFIQYAFNYLK